MPAVQDPFRPGWQVLVDTAGRRVGSFVRAERDGRPSAELFELETPVEDAVPIVLAELPGWRVVAGEELGRALVDAGGRLFRHSYVLTRDLVAHPASHAGPPPPGLELRAADRPAADLVGAYRAAFPPEHPDGAARVDEDPLEEMRRIVELRVVGPVLDCSGLAVDRQGIVRAAVIITDSGGTPPFGGPWVAECFRDPDPAYKGAGRALLERMLVDATAAGLPAIGLAVTHGNPAHELYLDLGFSLVFSAYSVDL
ncbi:GNAT family protein [Candidatus Solirubrobacter pratensis]|uniref:GNAT family N-acetyltransferase n=1 Tax=Candidatus Solirubrobacter pratensis TaxID=1298857 RepID=UPI0004853551|nr:GNAT family N-acetyltransferase [Candidatus Solirubrobacter pratensis]